MTSLPQVSTRMRVAVIALTVAFGLLLSVWATITPAFRGPDEVSHFSSAERMATAPAWPDPGDARMSGAVWGAFQERTTAAPERSTLGELREADPGLTDRLDWMTQHPPLYYAVAGGFLAAIGGDALRWDHALLALRLFDVLLVTPIVPLLFVSIRRITRSNAAGLVAAATPFAIPQFQQINSAVTNDALLTLLAAVVGWLSIRVITGDRRWQVLLGLGVALGLTTFTKGTGLPAAALVLFALLFGRGHPPRWPARIWQTVWPLATATAFGMFWWPLNVLRFGAIQPSATRSVRPDNPWPPGQGPNAYDYLVHLWDGFTLTFWGKVGALEFPIASPLVDILSVISLAVLVVYGFRTAALRRVNLILVAQPIGTILLLVYGTWGVYTRTQMIVGVQGRYFFACIVVLVAASALAWMEYVRSPRARRGVGIGVLALGVLMTVHGLIIALAGFYGASHLKFTFGNVLTWLGVSPIGSVPTAAIAAAAAIACAGAILLAGRELLPGRRATVPSAP
ncbi:DUF2142 domain-containing protein [Agromyces sp. SYSU T00266]|uniref:DUF2142 domain-containing protein n=1 Tax=Agromyces zhanjiangensis TaxID=3158562 RepID=UPI003391ECB6